MHLGTFMLADDGETEALEVALRSTPDPFQELGFGVLRQASGARSEDGGRGAFIFFSRVDYLVSEPRQKYAGPRDAR